MYNQHFCMLYPTLISIYQTIEWIPYSRLPMPIYSSNYREVVSFVVLTKYESCALLIATY